MAIQINKSELQPDDILSKVVILVSMGLTDVEIINHFVINDTKNKHTAETIKGLICDAKKYIKESVKIDIDYEHGNSLIRLNDLYKKSANIQDYKTCLRIQKQINGTIDKIQNSKDAGF